ncbi:MAG: DUF6206 family protein [Anaerolineales bacterium]|jgi:hypothetical protein
MDDTTATSFRNPKGFDVDFDLLQQFESNVNPISPENCPIPCRVLGYGEISTVFEIQAEGMTGLAFKRMSIFEAPEELSDYLDTYQEYNRLLDKEIGIHLPPHGHATFINEAGSPIFYIIQQKVNPSSIGNQLIHTLPREETLILLKCLLLQLLKLWRYNIQQADRELGIDGQISNWVVDNYNSDTTSLGSSISFLYIDTSTPLLRIQGIEQMDPELFLRSAPRFLAWVLRLFFVDEVVARYYDFRKVIIDLLANFYKEGKAELIPDLIVTANDFLAGEAVDLGIQLIDEKEVHDYYRQDALIWRLYLNMRRLDRLIYTKILRREYPYILPGKIER